jgi:hypothetical protein
MSTVDGRFKKLQFDFRHVDQWIAERLPKEAPAAVLVTKIFIRTEVRIEQIIYDIVYQLVSQATETRQEEYSYYTKILSQDDRFLKAVQKIYEDRHKDFERGDNLMNCN